MESYSFQFERMSNVDLHPLSLPVSRLSPAKSNSSIVEHLAHHQHGKGDSAYSSFSGGSTAPDYPSLFLPDDLQSSAFSHYADLKYVKSLYHPAQVLQSNTKTMDQLYHSVETIPQQYHNNSNINPHGHSSNGSLHTNSKAHSKQEVHSRSLSQTAQNPPHPPPIPTRLDSFIATKNLENSRVPTHGTEFQPLQLQSQQQPKPHNRLHSKSVNSQKSDTGSPDMGRFNSDSLYSVWRGSQQEQPQTQHPPVYRLHLQLQDQTRLTPEQPSITDNKTAAERQRSVNILSRSPPQGTNQPEQLMPKLPLGGAGCNGDYLNKSTNHFESERKNMHLAQGWRGSGPTRAASPKNTGQGFVSSSIQHKGQFYFVTGVCKPSESGLRTHSATVSGLEAESVASTLLETHCLRDRERCHSTMDNLFRQERSCSIRGTVQDSEVFTSVSQRKDLPFKSQDQVNYNLPIILPQSSQNFDESEEIDMMQSREIGRHTASNPIFYCGPDRNFPSHSATNKKEVGNKQFNYNKSEDHVNKEKRQPFGDVASERINKETTPLLYHLTGANRTVLQPKADPGFPMKGNEVFFNETDQEDVAMNDNEIPTHDDATKHDRGAVTSISSNTLDDSFNKYYKEKLKDAQCKVLRETSFKRRDLQLSWPHCMKQNPESRSIVIHSFSSSQDSETSTATLTPSMTSEETEKGSIKEEVRENQKETNKVTEKENGRPSNVAQPQVARIGGRKRLTPEQKKMCFSEPEKLNQIGSAPIGLTCRSFGDESKHLFTAEYEGEEPDLQREKGLVAARRKLFETRGRTLSASSFSKTNLKHMQQKALVEYMERKTGQKATEPQQPVLQLPPPTRQRHSFGEKPFDWTPRPLSGNQEGKNMKKKHNRPHSAGRILDSPSSSIRYAQFFSAQSCSGHYAGQQSSSKKRESQGPSQGKSASAESLLDQREPTGFFRNRSISTPHDFEAHDHMEDPLVSNTMETQSSLKSEAVESSSKQVPEGQQRASKVAQRGKSMEELGARCTTNLLPLSKSSEQLDKLRKNSALPEGAGRRETYFAEERAHQQEKQTGKGPEVVGQKNTQGQIQNQTQRKPLLKQSSEPRDDESVKERSSSRSNSPNITSSSHPRICSPPPGSQAAVIDELRSNTAPNETFSNPPSPRGQKISESETKSPSSTPIRTKITCENTPCSRSEDSKSGSEKEPSVDEPSSIVQPPPSKQEVSLSCGVTTDPLLWLLPPEEDNKDKVQTPLPANVFDQSISSILLKQTSESSVSPCMAVADADISQQVEKQSSPETEAEIVGKKEKMEERGAPEGETECLDGPVKQPKWEELVEAVVKADQSLARVFCPLANRKTALMLMEQLLSEDTLLMEEHYKKKQEQKGATESIEPTEGSEPSSSCPASDSQKSECAEQQNKADITEKKHLLVSYIKERLSSLEESRGALQMEAEENAARGEVLKLLVRDLCQPVELERYNLFIGDLERVVNLLLCLSARLARVQNALSIVDQHTDAEEKDLKKTVFLLKAMVAYDELGSLVPIKRTLQVIECQNQANKESEEPSNKRVRSLGRVTSLANLISPVKNGAVRRFGQTLQASFRGDGKSPNAPQKPCSKTPTPPKRRNSTLWSETIDIHQKGTFSTKEIKRQEAIFELSRGEQDLIEDLQLARKAYHDPMLKLSIMSEEELTHIFGNLDTYIPLHEDLLAQLSKATGPDGTVCQIGQIVVRWLPRLNAYKHYCSNQLAAKALLDQKKQDPRVQDFLQRCLESPFSRKLDLWSFLDIPRSRLVKYPLLLKEILKHTPAEHADAGSLEEAITIIQGVLSDINTKKGESECQYYIEKLEYLDDRQRDPRIEMCKSLLCHGEVRNKSGTKLHVFLFTELLVLTRPVSRNERQCFQVYRQPIPVQDLVLEDLQDGDVRMGGSFRGAFSNVDKAKNIFRVRSQDPNQAQSHTLQVNDVFHKQQWLNCLRSAISIHRPLNEPPTPSPTTSDPKHCSSLAIVHTEEADENCPRPASESTPSSPRSPTSSSSSTRSSSSSTTSLLSSPLFSTTLHKSKKDKKSLCSLGKRKETMV